MVNAEIFRPGEPAILEVRDYVKEKFTTHFRGVKSKHFIILDHPSKDGRPLPISDETQCIVRFIHEGEVIGCRTDVMAQVRNPAPLLFLRYPKQVESTKLRKHNRYPVNIETVLAHKKTGGNPDGHPVGVMLNLSEGGCLVKSPGAYEKGTHIFLTCYLPEQKTVVDLEAIVRRCAQKNGDYQLGLEFADLLHPAYEDIKSYLHMLMAYRVRAMAVDDAP